MDAIKEPVKSKISGVVNATSINYGVPKRVWDEGHRLGRMGHVVSWRGWHREPVHKDFVQIEAQMVGQGL